MMQLVLQKVSNLWNHAGFRRYFANTAWLFAEKILRMVVGLFVGVWVARYLGPERYGLLSYAQSFVGLFGAIATLGLDGIVVRELVKDESKRNLLLGTAFLLKLFGAIMVLIVLAIAIKFTSNNQFANILIFIIGSATIFQSFNVIDLYFQSKVISRYVVFTNMLSLAMSSIIKIGLILYQASLIAFALMVPFDSIILALGYLYFYLKFFCEIMKAHERLLLSLDSDKFTDESKKILLELNIPLKEFSEISDIPYSTLYKIVQGRDFRVSTLKKIIDTIKEFEKDKDEIDKIAVIAARPSLNKIKTKIFSVKGKDYLLKEYPANSLEDCITASIQAEREGVKAIICAPIVSSSIEKVVRVPVAVVIPEKDAFMNALEIVANKI